MQPSHLCIPILIQLSISSTKILFFEMHSQQNEKSSNVKIQLRNFEKRNFKEL
jgi:hypothetical protein